MNQKAFNPPLFALLFALAFGYTGWILIHSTITGSPRLDGTIGVILGLFIGSHPAANLIDILLYKRLAHPTTWGYLVNLAVLVLGWLVIFTGAMQFLATTGLGLR